MDPLFQFLCRMGDNTLILGHRLSEWCGVAPILEEDIDVIDFRNVLLVERPNDDFAVTMMRQFLFDSWHIEMLGALQSSTHADVAAIAAKSLKEVQYHVLRSSETVIALGDGTIESHDRMQSALDELWPFFGELFHDDAIDLEMCDAGIAPKPSSLREKSFARLETVFAQATLIQPESQFAHKGGKDGFQHTEHLGHLLAQMQWMQRAYPGMSW